MDHLAAGGAFGGSFGSTVVLGEDLQAQRGSSEEGAGLCEVLETRWEVSGKAIRTQGRVCESKFHVKIKAREAAGVVHGQ